MSGCAICGFDHTSAACPRPPTVSESYEGQARRIKELETALFEYGMHHVGCRYGEVAPNAVCTCGLERAINGDRK